MVDMSAGNSAEYGDLHKKLLGIIEINRQRRRGLVEILVELLRTLSVVNVVGPSVCRDF